MQELDTAVQSRVDAIAENFRESLTSVGTVIDYMEIHTAYGIDLLEVEESN